MYGMYMSSWATRHLGWFCVPPVVLLAFAQNAGRPPIKFADVTESSKVRFLHRSSATSQKYLIESMSGGTAVFDYNGDGLLDIFLVNGAQLTDPMAQRRLPDKVAEAFWNRLYRNNGDGTFTDVTNSAGVRGSGYGMGVAAGDYDNDGRMDFYVTSFGRNTLYHNNGDGTFTDVTVDAGVGAADGQPEPCSLTTIATG